MIRENWIHFSYIDLEKTSEKFTEEEAGKIMETIAGSMPLS